MPISLACPACAARLKAPDGSAGRTLGCPKCRGAVVVPSVPGPATDFTFDRETDQDDGTPFDAAGPSSEPGELDNETPRTVRRATKKKRKAGYNPFDDGADEPSSAETQPKKRRYRKDADFNPFGDGPDDEVPDPAGGGFEFGLEGPPATPTGEFDFGPPPHPGLARGDDPDDSRRRRR